MPTRPSTDASPDPTPSGNWFPSFFDQVPHFAVLLALDGTVAEANRASLETGGYARADVAGRAFWECGWWNGAAGLAGQVRAGVEASARGDTVRLEVPHFCANGERRFIGLVLAPVAGPDGTPLFIAATGTDITERYGVEERLRLLDSIGEATRVASDPKVIMEEATRLLGEYLGATRVAYADLEADNDRFTIRHDWRVPGAISTVGVYSLDLFGSRARANLRMGRNLVIGDVDSELAPEDGKDMFNQIGIKAIVCCGLAKGGRLVAMMAVHQEQPRAWSAEEVALVDAVVERCWAHIERVRSTEALRAADRHKSEFLATLAHELRNPLAPLRNGLDILRLADGNPALRASVRDTMDRQLRHMTHLVSDLLDIARVASGKIVLQKEIVDVRAVVESAVESTAPLVEGARHRLSVTLPDGPVAIEADAVRMSQVIGNLLTNAAKYTAPGGRIALDVALDPAPEGDAVVIAVADDGIGIPAEALGAVFEMFTQVAKNIDRANGGLGIGLSLVKKLVELHGGTVRAASPGPGQGSTFTIRLPLAAQGLPQAGADGIALAQLAFLDIGMPRMDGYETARRLRAMPQLAALTLVALTGWGAAEDRARSRAAGFDRHLLKPAAAEDIRAVLAGAGRRDDQGL